MCVHNGLDRFRPESNRLIITYTVVSHLNFVSAWLSVLLSVQGASQGQHSVLVQEDVTRIEHRFAEM